MSYWDRVQPTGPESFQFEELDRQLEILAQNNKTATLVLGIRQPRWPECHRPAWAEQLDPSLQDYYLLQFIRETVNRYESSSVISSWQLENEASNRLFGICPEFDAELFNAEYELVDSLSNNPIRINASNQSGWPVRGPVGDRTGFSIYKEAYFDAFGRQNAWNFWYVPSWWHSFRAAMVELQHDTTSFVHELQTEPWGPDATVNLPQAVQRDLFPPDELERNIKFAEQTGMKDIWLWGVEWWYYQDETHGNSSYLFTVTDSIKAAH